MIAMALTRRVPITRSSTGSFSVDRCSSCKRSATRSLYSVLRPASWCDQDIWFMVMKFLSAKSLLRLALVNRAFYRLVMEKCVWKTACHRDLKVPYDATPQFSWRDLYTSAVDGSHAYSLQDSDRHVDWFRVGSFRIQSGEALVTGDFSRLASSLVQNTKSNEHCKSVKPYTIITNVETGSWIADLHLLRCPLCTQPACDGTMQVLDARHWELFLHEEYRKGEWIYEEVEERVDCPPCDAATAGILDAQNLKSQSTKELLDLKSWLSPSGVYQPAAESKMFAAAASTNLPENEGLVVKVYTMRAGKDVGPAVAIRITQCLAQ